MLERDCLVLRFDDDSDGTGKVLARARFQGFAGESGAYFGIARLEEFAREIEAFPIPADPAPVIAGGFWKKDRSGELEQELLAVAVYPVGVRGQIGVQVRMMTELWPGDRAASQCAVKLELLTTSEALSRFAREIRALVKGRATEATLDVDIMA